MLDNLKKYRVILASQSPRRAELLKMMNVDFEVDYGKDGPLFLSNDESYPHDMPAGEVPVYLAKKKNYLWRLKVFGDPRGEKFLHGVMCGTPFHLQYITTRAEQARTIVISADTIVYLPEQNEILEKPKDEAQAVEMLRKLSGKEHLVISGVCVTTSMDTFTFSDTTRVTFRKLDEEEIRYYVQKYRPLDKAGAYGIQEWIGVTAIQSIEGSFYNVMGLPTGKLYEVLKKLPDA